jgi:phenylalanine ammonia-lyase
VKKKIEHSLDSPLPQSTEAGDVVIIQGNNLTINDVVRVARYNVKAKLTNDEDILRRVKASHDYIINATKACRPTEGVMPKTCKPIYGITTGFGGMANTLISPDDAR